MHARPGPRPSAAPSTRPARCRQERAHQRARHQRPAQLLEDDDGLGHREAGAGGLGQGQREHAGLAQRGPVVVADGAVVALPGAEALERQPPGHHGPDALGQLALVLADAEVHQRRALGRPRMRSATMLRCTCEVPAAMVSEIDLNHVGQLLGVAERRAVGPGQRVGAQRGPVEDLHGQVAQGLRVLGEGELEDRPADARDPGLRRLRDVALGQRPQRVEGGDEVADASGQAGVVPKAEALGDASQLAQQAHALEQLAHEGRAPLEGQRDHGDAPAVVLVADAVGHRDPHLVEEELGELGGPRDGAQRADLDAGRVHRHDQPGDAAVAVLAGAHQQLAEVGHLGVRRPDLRARHHVVVAVADGPRAQRGQVAAGVGLAEALAPDLLAAQDGRAGSAPSAPPSPRR